jgi:orotate phosphoribosyltransferase
MAIAQKLQIPMISIKKTPKKYGLKNMLEGPLVGLPILLVDDLAGSQITLVNNYNLLSSFQVPIASEYVTLVDKTIGTHDSYLKEKKLISLFKCEDFKLSWTNYVHEYNREPNFGISY